jgi:hypothetical protein
MDSTIPCNLLGILGSASIRSPLHSTRTGKGLKPHPHSLVTSAISHAFSTSLSFISLDNNLIHSYFPFLSLFCTSISTSIVDTNRSFKYIRHTNHHLPFQLLLPWRLPSRSNSLIPFETPFLHTSIRVRPLQSALRARLPAFVNSLVRRLHAYANTIKARYIAGLVEATDSLNT